MAALLARTDAVTKEVTALRGLKLKKKLDREVVDHAELRRRLHALADDPDAQAQMRAEGLALARWGLIPRDTNYLQLMVDLLTVQTAGFYDATTKKLTISSAAVADPAWAELVLAHEIDHGLQDQAFDLVKLQSLPATEDDALLARRALVEGDGLALMIELALARQNLDPPWGDPAVARQVEAAMALPPGDVLDRAPLAVREAMLFPYRSGFAFVASLRQNASWSAVNRAYRRPPRSTEQILHPDKYASDDKPLAVPFAQPPSLVDYTVAHSTVWGELGYAERAAHAAAGWGGDRVLVLARPGETRASRAIGVARLAWDSEPDAVEAHDAAVRALDVSLIGATLDHVPDRTRWLAIDGTVTWIERRGNELVIAVGVPVQLASQTLADELWAPAPSAADHASK